MARALGWATLALCLLGAGRARTASAVLEDARRACRAYTGNDEGLVAAYAELEQLVAADPKNALAWYRMGDILMLRACPGLRDCNEPMLKAAKELIDRALAVDPRLPEGHVGRGWIFKLRRDGWAAEESAKTALGLRPGFISALNLKGAVAKEQARYDDAVAAGSDRRPGEGPRRPRVGPRPAVVCVRGAAAVGPRGCEPSCAAGAPAKESLGQGELRRISRARETARRRDQARQGGARADGLRDRLADAVAP